MSGPGAGDSLTLLWNVFRISIACAASDHGDEYNARNVPVCPFPATMCRTVFPLSSLAVASASGPHLSMNDCMSSTSPYRHDSSNSSISSCVVLARDIASKWRFRRKKTTSASDPPCAKKARALQRRYPFTLNKILQNVDGTQHTPEYLHNQVPQPLRCHSKLSGHPEKG